MYSYCLRVSSTFKKSIEKLNFFHIFSILFTFRFAVLDRDLLTIKPHDTWADFDNHFYERVVAFKKKGVKVTVAIGGWVKIYFNSPKIHFYIVRSWRIKIV